MRGRDPRGSGSTPEDHPKPWEPVWSWRPSEKREKLVQIEPAALVEFFEQARRMIGSWIAPQLRHPLDKRTMRVRVPPGL